MLRGNLNDILVFMAIVDAGSFVGGGQAMGLTRSAAGKSVSRLEDRLGVRLLNRTTRTLALTDEGRGFYDHGLKILALVDDAESSLKGQGGKPRGLLRLTVPDAFGRRVVLPLLGKYLKAWPDVQIEVNFTDRPTDLIEEGFDLAVRVGTITTDSRLMSRVIAKYKVKLCASPAYIAKHGQPHDVDSLSDHDCLIFSSRARKHNWSFRDRERVWKKGQGRNRLRMDSGEAIRDAAIAGLGIAYLPEFLIASDLASGRLCQVLPEVEIEERKIVAMYPTKRFLEPRVRHFIDLLVQELGN